MILASNKLKSLFVPCWSRWQGHYQEPIRSLMAIFFLFALGGHGIQASHGDDGHTPLTKAALRGSLKEMALEGRCRPKGNW